LYDVELGEFVYRSCVLPPQGVALGTMVGWLTYGNKKFEALDSQMRKLIPPLRQAMLDFIPMVDADTNAFSGFMVRLLLINVVPREALGTRLVIDISASASGEFVFCLVRFQLSTVGKKIFGSFGAPKVNFIRLISLISSLSITSTA